MDIDLANSIVIIDEAHNIEDAARRAASLDQQYGEKQNLQKAKNELLFIHKHKSEIVQKNLLKLVKFLSSVCDFLDIVSIPTDEQYIIKGLGLRLKC